MGIQSKSPRPTTKALPTNETGLPAPSPFLIRSAPLMLEGLSAPIADIACGSGRNTFYLAEQGAPVIAVDRDVARFELFKKSISRSVSDRIEHFRVDLEVDPWPFKKNSLGGACMIHFLNLDLLPLVSMSLRKGAHLLIETIGGQGENYLVLPQAGVLRARLEKEFELKTYQERPVGPTQKSVAAVKLLARKRSPPFFGCV